MVEEFLREACEVEVRQVEGHSESDSAGVLHDAIDDFAFDWPLPESEFREHSACLRLLSGGVLRCDEDLEGA